MILHQFFPLVSKPKFVLDENEFLVRKIHGVLLPPGTVWIESYLNVY